MGYSYRHCSAPADVIFTGALMAGEARRQAAIRAEMDEVAEHRETKQPIKSRTGGSTFKNPPGHSAWKLIDAAGCRGFRVGGAQVSEMHCNFLINVGDATGADIETLGEEVRAAREGEFGRRARMGDQADRGGGVRAVARLVPALSRDPEPLRLQINARRPAAQTSGMSARLGSGSRPGQEVEPSGKACPSTSPS